MASLTLDGTEDTDHICFFKNDFSPVTSKALAN